MSKIFELKQGRTTLRFHVDHIRWYKEYPNGSLAFHVKRPYDGKKDFLANSLDALHLLNLMHQRSS